MLSRCSIKRTGLEGLGSVRVEILPLRRKRSAVSLIADWYYHEWGCMNSNVTVSGIEARLTSQLDSVSLPQPFVALVGHEVIGAVELKIREIRDLVDYEHWIGGVYVTVKHRRKGVGTEIVKNVVDIAANEFGIKTLYLQTERLDGGIYSRLGFIEATRFKYDGLERLVMVNEIA